MKTTKQKTETIEQYLARGGTIKRLATKQPKAKKKIYRGQDVKKSEEILERRKKIKSAFEQTYGKSKMKVLAAIASPLILQGTVPEKPKVILRKPQQVMFFDIESKGWNSFITQQVTVISKE